MRHQSGLGVGSSLGFRRYSEEFAQGAPASILGVTQHAWERDGEIDDDPTEVILHLRVRDGVSR